jgi:dihydroorotate dehydrogenase
MRHHARGVIYRSLRPLLFRLEPEAAHALSLRALGWTGAVPPLGALVRAVYGAGAARPVRLFDLDFPNPIGLAAGYDKDGRGWRGLACLGFGHVEVGTVTPEPQPGNPAPRVFRLPEDRSLINRLGFPSEGADALARRLQGPRPAGLILGVNIGKQKTTPLERAVEDYAALMVRFAPLADYLAVNISSPNTESLRELQQREWLEPLVARLVANKNGTPLLVKLAPDLDDRQLDESLDVLLAGGVDGVIATNTTLSREGLRSPRAGEAGGLSGAALTARSTRMVAAIVERTDDKLPVIACGGVMGPDDARAKLDAGARLVQLYTGLIYEGPGLVKRILKGL